MARFLWLPGKYWLFAFLLFVLPICGCEEAEFRLEPAFYHWKSSIKISPAEYDFMQKTGSKRLYVRFFDMVWSNDGPIPIANLSVDSVDAAVAEIVPVVFCKERVFRNLRADGVDTVAARVLHLMEQYMPRLYSSEKVREIQFDCDWASQSQAEYFLFLKAIKTRLPKHITVSSTLRLHQLKFPEKTGVPPCDRVMLMVYNTGDVRAMDGKNSILSVEDAAAYLNASESYPLPIDVALPVYDWLLLYRDDHLYKIIYPPQTTPLSDTIFFQKTDTHTWRVKAPVQFQGHYLHPEDNLVLERSEMDVLEEVWPLLRPFLGKSGAHHVSFYHLDTLLLQRFEPATLRNLIAQ